MADLADVTSEIANRVTAAVYPNGVPPQPPIAGNAVTVMQGWPLPEDLDAIVVDQFAATVVARILVSIFPRPGMYRNTSRYPTKWLDQTRPAKTLTSVAAGVTVTIGGAAPGVGGPVQNIALIVGFGGGRRSFVYTTLAGDTITTIAAALASLVNAATPASSVGPVITIAAAFSITARVGIIGTVARELRRQVERVDINIWAPSPTLRDQIAAPVRTALANLDWLTMADNFAARIRACDDHWLDDPEKAGLFRRLLGYDIEYPTTESKAASEIIVFQSTTSAGQFIPDSPVVTILY
jgi:hypothetical protein